MRLKKIIKNLEICDIKNYKNYNIKTITHISNDVEKDSIFICIKGNNFDGNDYVLDAKNRGAKCIITESDLDVPNVCVIRVNNVRIAMSIVAKNFYNNCCDKFKLIGVIGTSGKTTTSLIIGKLLQDSDNSIGIIGTNGIFIGNIRMDNNFTTPDPLELHYAFYQMSLLGVKTVVMEVSAQAIYLHKLYGIKFDICVFTNITEEHIDFFGSMENYAKTKMDFFDPKNMKECVVNVDDFYGMEIAYKTKVPCISYSVKNPANSFAVDIVSGITDLKFTANVLDEILDVDSALLGDFNVYNILAGVTVAKMVNVATSDIESRLAGLPPIPGRLNTFVIGNKTIVVDFAHAPDSFEKTLSFVSSFCKGKMLIVFGCVGYSDKAKRMAMGAIASKYCSQIILTVDNCGNTSFDEICNDIERGLSGAKYTCIEDRKSAIEFAFGEMRDFDILCILGKGAEDFQKIGDEKIHYSDLETVEQLIKG